MPYPNIPDYMKPWTNQFGNLVGTPLPRAGSTDPVSGRSYGRFSTPEKIAEMAQAGAEPQWPMPVPSQVYLPENFMGSTGMNYFPHQPSLNVPPDFSPEAQYMRMIDQYGQRLMNQQARPMLPISNRRDPWTREIVPQGTSRRGILERPPGLNQPAPFPMNMPGNLPYSLTSSTQTRMPPQITNYGSMDAAPYPAGWNQPNIPDDMSNWRPGGVGLRFPEQYRQKPKRETWSSMLKPPEGSWEAWLYK